MPTSDTRSVLNYPPPSKHHIFESVLDYKKNGFCPIHLNDLITLEGREFQIIHKLGSGGTSTVWLARESVPELEAGSRFVSLKIYKSEVTRSIMAEITSESDLRSLEDRIACRLATEYTTSPEGSMATGSGSFRFSNVDQAELGDSGFLKSVNGRHMCVAGGVYGPSVQDALHSGDGSMNTGGRFLRRVAHNTTRALAFMHRSGVAHGDLHSDQVLLTLDDFPSWTQEELDQRLKAPETVDPFGHPESPTEPVYIVPHADLKDLTPYCTDEITLIDFGSSYFFDGKPPPERPLTLWVNDAPELFTDPKRPLQKSSDIWALACTIFKIRSSESLFTWSPRAIDEAEWRDSIHVCIQRTLWDTRFPADCQDDILVHRILAIGSPPSYGSFRVEGSVEQHRYCKFRNLVKNLPEVRTLTKIASRPERLTTVLRPVLREAEPITALEAAFLYDLLKSLLLDDPDKRGDIRTSGVAWHPYFLIDFEAEEQARREKSAFAWVPKPNLFVQLKKWATTKLIPKAVTKATTKAAMSEWENSKKCCKEWKQLKKDAKKIRKSTKKDDAEDEEALVDVQSVFSHESDFSGL